MAWQKIQHDANGYTIFDFVVANHFRNELHHVTGSSPGTKLCNGYILKSYLFLVLISLTRISLQYFSSSGMCLCLITYTTEICSTKYRGIMLSSVVVAFNLGATICNVLMYFFSWNVVSLIFSGFSVFGAFLVFLLPESPVWLYSKGRTQKAIDILHSIRNGTSEEIANEAEEIRHSFAEQKEQIGCIQMMKNCFKAWRQMVILMGFTLVIMHAGHYIVLSYTVMVVDGLKIPFDEATISLCYSIVGIGASFFSPFFFYNYNRKPTLAISTFGMGLGMTIVAVHEEIYLYEKDKPAAWIVPLSLFLYVACSNVAILPLGFIIGGEILPAEGRGVLFGIGSGFTSIYYTLTLKFYPQVLFCFGIKPLLWCFAVNSFIVTLFAVFVLPETRGKTLNEVQEQYFKGGKMEKKSISSIQIPTKLEA